MEPGAASSGSNSDHAVIIESSDESLPDLIGDESTSDDGDESEDESTSDDGLPDLVGSTDDDEGASLWVGPGSVAGDVQITIDSDDDIHPLEHMHKRRRMTAVPRHRVYADDGAGPTYANLRCLEAN
jgi:hypothetical protein